jgi:hypothetical protein
MMQNEHRVPSGKARSATTLSRINLPFLCWVLALWLVAACAPQTTPSKPPNLYPSRVITQDGMAFMVQRLRIPGTRQEISLRFGDSRQWMALDLLRSVRFTGPIKGGYRQADIILSSGERIQAEVFVNTVVEGSTDLGYWNMSLSRVESLDLGSD